jgi:hypothetical protein
MTPITPKAASAPFAARPPSAVSSGVGLAGLATLLAGIVAARALKLTGPAWALAAVAACGVAMAAWSLIVDRVHRRATTGLDWAAPLRAWDETIENSVAKLAGLWFTWGVIGAVYAVARPYSSGDYAFAMQVFSRIALPLFVLSIPYVLWIDRRLKHPKDGAWALGAWLMGDRDVSRDAIADHWRAWAVKGFFLAFMLSGVPGGFAAVTSRPWAQIVASPANLALTLIELMFVVDMALATVGYVLTLKPLDAHIRSATPYVDGWVAALICYPPVTLMWSGGLLDYHPGTQPWTFWLARHEGLMAVWGAVLVVLTASYAWATMAFGLRFSNLTNRGILTHGPYRWTKHPAYWSKNAFWWLSAPPFLVTTASGADAIRNTLTLAAVSGVYWWRAKTEEKHLMNDAGYRRYVAWLRVTPWAKR